MRGKEDSEDRRLRRLLYRSDFSVIVSQGLWLNPTPGWTGRIGRADLTAHNQKRMHAEPLRARTASAPGRLGGPVRTAGIVLWLGLLGAVHGWAADKPNIVYLIADDLGWKDVGFHGGRIQTPNLDRLAAGGAVLNAFYAQPFSTQTRAALMTGRYPMRYGLQTATILPSSQFGLPTEERTLAQALKEAGYATAFIGKWQLGHARPEFWPTRRGFDYFYGSLSGQVDFRLQKSTKADWRRGEQPVKEEGYVTALLGRDAANVIGATISPGRCFSCVSFTAPAAPYGAPKELLDKYREIPDDAQRSYAAAVTALDDAVGDSPERPGTTQDAGRHLDRVSKRQWRCAARPSFPRATPTFRFRRGQRYISRGAGQPLRRRRAGRGAGTRGPGESNPKA